MTKLADLAHWKDYNPVDFGWGGEFDPEAHGNQLTPLVVDGVSFGSCHIAAHGLFVAFVTELARHIQGGLHAGSCGCYSTTDNLPDGSRSFHSYGIAVDVNWNVNHMGNYIPDAKGEWAVPRAAATTLALKYGLEWGGNWQDGYHDNMHFEVHLSPSIARGFSTYLPGPVRKLVGRTSGWPLKGKHVFGAPHPQADGLITHDGKGSPTDRDYVQAIQKLLASHHATPTDGSWKPNGLYGAGTEAAVKRWQAATHRNVTGRIASSDWKALTK